MVAEAHELLTFCVIAARYFLQVGLAATTHT